MKRDVFLFFKLLFFKFNYHDIFGKAAEISYYLLFSLFPMLLLLISLLPFLKIEPAIITNYTSQFFPPDIELLIDDLITYILNNPSTSAISFGALFTLYSASGAISAILKNLNHIYKGSLTKNFLKYKAISLILTLSSLLIVFSYLFLTTFVFSFIHSIFGNSLTTILFNFKFLLTPFLLFILSYSFYFIANNSKHNLSSIIPGVSFFILSFFLSSKFFTLYLRNFSHYSIKYGALSSIIIMLLWLFIIAFLILFGGLLNSTIIDWKNLKSKEKTSFAINYNKLISNFK